jgi:hypothetical protein
MIYLFRSGHWAKVGYTARGAVDRLRQLQTGSPEPIDLVATVLGDLKLEQLLHRALKTLCEVTRGEWYWWEDLVSLGVARAFQEGDIRDWAIRQLEHKQEFELQIRSRMDRVRQKALRRSANKADLRASIDKIDRAIQAQCSLSDGERFQLGIQFLRTQREFERALRERLFISRKLAERISQRGYRAGIEEVANDIG